MVSGKVVVPIVAVVAAVAAVALIVLMNRDDPPTAAGPASTSQNPGQLTATEAARLVDDLTSGDDKRVRSAVAVSPAQPLNIEAVSGLAAIEAMTFDLRTFRDRGHGTAEIAAQVLMPGSTSPTTWNVRLVAVEDQWLVSSTELAL